MPRIGVRVKRKGEHMKTLMKSPSLSCIPALPRIMAPMLAVAALSACQTTTTVTTATTLACEAGKYQSLVGRNVGEVTPIAGVVTRTLTPGQPATMDYREDRLNLIVDEKGFIQQVTCG